LHFRRQRRDIGLARGGNGPGECCARRLGAQAPDRDPGDDQFVGSLPCRREGRRVEFGECMLGLVEAADQE